MSVEPVDIGTSGPGEPVEAAPEAKAPEPSDAQTSKRPDAQAARRGLPSQRELARLADEAFAKAAGASKETSGTGGRDLDGNVKGKADSKASKADPKASPTKADGRDEHGRFVSGEGGKAPPRADGKASGAEARGKGGEAGKSEPEAKAEPKAAPARPRRVEGADGPDADITNEQLADDAELNRRFTALTRKGRFAADRLAQAQAAQQRLEQERAAFAAERERAAKDPSLLRREEAAQLAVTDPIALLERLGVNPNDFHRALLSSGTEASRVERLERELKAERERKTAEAEEARRRQETEQTEAQRRRAAEEEEQNWEGIRGLLSEDTTRPTVSRIAKSNFRYVRSALEEAGRDAEEALAARWQVPVSKVGSMLTSEHRVTIFNRCLDRLEDQFAEHFGTSATSSSSPARGAPQAPRAERDRAATQSPPEGNQTITPRLASEGTPRTNGVMLSNKRLVSEALRAFERTASGDGR